MELPSYETTESSLYHYTGFINNHELKISPLAWTADPISHFLGIGTIVMCYGFLLSPFNNF